MSAPMPRRSPGGYTLVELLVYVGIATIAIVVFTSFMVDVSKQAAYARIRQEVHHTGRVLLTRMISDIRNAQSVTITSPKELHLVTPSGSAIRYVWNDDPAILQAEFDDGSGSGTVPLTSSAVRVTLLDFQYRSADTNEISVHLRVAQGNESAAPERRADIDIASVGIRRRSLYQ
ncbi:MAG: type II secretion system protein [bacterium]|nr:type II secretion system protein [bacterium]